MKCIFLLFVLPVGLLATSCASKSDEPSSPVDGVSPEELKKNPIQGIAAAKVLIDTGAYTDGPVWHATEKVLFYTVPLGEGDVPGLYRVRPDGSAMKVRGGSIKTGELPVGNAVNKNGDLVTVEAKRIMRGAAGAEPVAIAAGYPSEKGVTPFDTLNDVVVHGNGTMYVTDPGVFRGTRPPMSNRPLPDRGRMVSVPSPQSVSEIPAPRKGVAPPPGSKLLLLRPGKIRGWGPTPYRR